LFKGAGTMCSHYAFVSESGNYEFDFEGETDINHFVVIAVLISDENFKIVQQKLDEIKINQVSMKTCLKDQ